VTLTELITDWKKRYIALHEMTKIDYGEESPEKNKTIMTMKNQLGYCIKELEALMQGTPARRAMSSMIKARRADDDNS